MTDEEKTKLLGTAPVAKLLRQFAVPSIIAMAAMSIYNVTDSIFVGHWVGAMGLTGIAVSFPLMNLMGAFGSMIGAGVATLISIRLGEKNNDGANAVLGNLTFLALIFGIVLSAVGIIFMEPILYFFGAGNASFSYASSYSTFMLLGGVIPFLLFGYGTVLRASGKPQYAMKAMLLTVVINLALDPVFIYVCGWGIVGAAVATVLAELIALIWEIMLLSRKSNVVRFKRKIFSPQLKLIYQILTIGLAAFLMEICTCVETILINNLLQKYGGDVAVGAYGIIFKSCFLFMTIIWGICQGMQPIAGFNYGAKKYDRMFSAVRYSMLYSTVVATVGFTLLVFCPHLCSAIFTSDPEMIKVASHGLPIASCTFPLFGFAVPVMIFFQSIGKVAQSAFLSVSRATLFLLPFIFWFASLYGVDGVWYSLILADAISIVATVILLFAYLRKFRYGHVEMSALK